MLPCAQLLVSELVTDAVLHGATPITVQVECNTTTAVVVCVHDEGPAHRHLVRASTHDEGGYGIALVDAVSDAWGVQPAEQDGAPVVAVEAAHRRLGQPRARWWVRCLVDVACSGPRTVVAWSRGGRVPIVAGVPGDVRLSSETSPVLGCAPGCGRPVSAAVRRHDGRTVRGCVRHCAQVLLGDPGAVVLSVDGVPDPPSADGAADPVFDTPLGVVAVVGPLSAAAGRLAQHLVAPLGRRWAHTRAVAARAATGTGAVGEERADVLVAAAWLHDIGYAPALRRHGFHPVDGAEHLSGAGWPLVVCGLVAHHSGARFVARVRGLTACLAPYDDPVHWCGPVADALTWADQTTGPDGQVVDVETRLAEVLARHGPTSPNARCHSQRGPVVRAAVAATERRLTAAGAPVPATAAR